MLNYLMMNLNSFHHYVKIVVQVCHDAVELGCDHNDEDICQYCNNCLINLISNNNDKCPINNHINPIIVPNRATRRHILKLMVNCPYSIKYKQQQQRNKNNNGQRIDTNNNNNMMKKNVL